MEYLNIKIDGYILGVACVKDNGNITKYEFDEISSVIRAKPIAPLGFDYRLKETLVWELFEQHILV